MTVEERLVGAVPDDGVARCAEKADARMIVVASSGMGAAGRWLMGSISERIAETAWVPTLVVRDAAVLEAWLRDERPLKIFVGADFTPTSDAALRWVEELTKIAPCEVTVGYVDRHAEERGEQALHLPAGAPRAPEMQEMLTHDLREKARVLYGKHEVHVHVLPAADRVDLRLIELAREANADLIVVGTHQWHGLSRLRHHSVSRRVLHEAKVSVACVPGHTLAHGANAQIPKVRRVLAATDLSTHGGHAVPYAFSMLESGGEVRVVHVVKPAEPHESAPRAPSRADSRRSDRARHPRGCGASSKAAMPPQASAKRRIVSAPISSASARTDIRVCSPRRWARSRRQ